MSLKQIILWSWLTIRESKSEIFCPPDLQVTNEEFAAELAARIRANRLPAKAELFEVDWDDAGIKQQRILIRHTGGADVVRLLVGVDQIGAFSYVEEKVFMKPPPLPPITKPREKKTFTREKPTRTGSVLGGLAGISVMLLGIGSLTEAGASSSLFGLVGTLVGTFLLIAAVRAYRRSSKAIEEWQKEYHETQEWNRQAEEEQKAWNAWEEDMDAWYEDVLEAVHLSRTNDVEGRFTLAVSSTVRQVIKTLFEDRQAELRERIEKERTQKEIEEELEKRKQEGFK